MRINYAEELSPTRSFIILIFLIKNFADSHCNQNHHCQYDMNSDSNYQSFYQNRKYVPSSFATPHHYDAYIDNRYYSPTKSVVPDKLYWPLQSPIPNQQNVGVSLNFSVSFHPRSNDQILNEHQSLQVNELNAVKRVAAESLYSNIEQKRLKIIDTPSQKLLKVTANTSNKSTSCTPEG